MLCSEVRLEVDVWESRQSDGTEAVDGKELAPQEQIGGLRLS